MMRFDRRKFMSALGLTAGGAALPAIADRLISRAYGQQQPVERLVAFWFIGGSIQVQQGQTGWGLIPPELKGEGESGVGGAPELSGNTSFAWPKKLAPLSELRSKVAIVDGLNNQTPGASAHGSMFQATTCTPGGGTPGGPSIDQAIAQAVGSKSAMSSILVGYNEDSIRLKLERTVDSFAAGPGSPVPHTTSVALLMRELFGGGAGDGGKAPSPKPVMDSLRLDIKRLESRFAAEERRGLEDYLRLVEQFEAQQAARAALDCGVAPVLPAGSPEEMAAAMTQALTLAFQCGISRVAGVAIGTGGGHEDMPAYTATTGEPIFDGHSFSYDYSRQAGLVQTFHMSLIAQMHQALGDKLVTVYTCDSGMAPMESEAGAVFTHHAANYRVPAIVVGDWGGGIKTGGRYLRYGCKVSYDHTNGAGNNQSIADLFLSIAHGMGAALPTFGGPQQVVPTTGPLPELLV